MHSSFEARQLTLSYCKTELIVATIYFAASLSNAFLFSTCHLFIEFNQYRLPFSIFFKLLPLENSFINWFLNYLYQIYVIIFAGLFLLLFFALTLNIMNHACWGADITILLVQQLGKILDDEDCHDASKMLRKALVARKLKRIIEMTHRVIDYHGLVHRLVQPNFFIEFTCSAFLLCMLLYTLKTDVFSVILLPTILAEILMYCWMGSRVIDRYDRLAASLYAVKWYSMDVKHQKDLQLILLRFERMKGFNGIFKTVSLHTFQKVVSIFNSAAKHY